MIKTDICKVENCGKLRDKSQGSSMCVMHRVRWSRYKSHDLPIKKLPDGIVHICKKHGELTIDQAYTNDNYSSYQCLQCKRLAMKKFEEKNPERDTNILKKNIYICGSRFKFPKEEYKKLHLQQNGVCAICKNPESIIYKGKLKALSIDHCHESETKGILKVRGLLCSRCNVIIGCTKDKSKLSQSAIDYLKASE